jgi:hypothetical protein
LKDCRKAKRIFNNADKGELMNKKQVVTELSEQEQLLGEVKQQLDDKKKSAIKAFVVKKLKEINDATVAIDDIKAECAERIENEKELIA